MLGLKVDNFRQIQKDNNFDDAAIAKYIGVSHSTVWRILNGKMQPGADFISAILVAFPDVKFEDLFFVS